MTDVTEAAFPKGKAAFLLCATREEEDRDPIIREASCVGAIQVVTERGGAAKAGRVFHPASAKARPMDAATLRAHADRILSDATIPELPGHYRGKVRDNYDLPDGRRVMVASDRLSAFDRILCAVPFKGQVLTEVARFWFAETADICRNHVLAHPDPNVVVGQRLRILPVEIVVRGHLAGTTGTSLLTLYRQGRRDMYGLSLPDGMRANEALPEPVITPTSKAADGDHDAPLTPAEHVLDEIARLQRGIAALDHLADRAALHRRADREGRDIAFHVVHPAAHIGVDRQPAIGDAHLPFGQRRIGQRDEREVGGGGHPRGSGCQGPGACHVRILSGGRLRMVATVPATRK